MKEPSAPSADRLWIWFGLTSIVFLVVLAISPFKDYFREYRRYQIEYRQLLLEHAGSRQEVQEAEALSVGIRQIWIPELDNQVDRCVSCHLGVADSRLTEVAQPYRTHPPVPHVPEDLDRFGCVVCHRGQGRATTVADAHGEVAGWETPLLPLPYTEASCGTCHEDTTVPESSMVSAGRKLMAKAGCYACHELRGHESWRSDAPNLNGLAQKTHVAWLRAWLDDPAALQPDTWMPDFRLEADEIEALVAFLWVQPPSAGHVVSADGVEPGDYDRGRTLFRESRCISCHTVEGKGNGSAPELIGVGSKVNRSWLVSFLANPHDFQPHTAMPRYVFERQDVLDLAEYMVEELYDPSAPEPIDGTFRPALKQIEEGERLYKRYGCGSCHSLDGRPDAAPIGPELTGIGTKPVERLDFGRREDLLRSLEHWLAAKIMEPRSFREDLKMPVLNFTPEQVQSIVMALLACTDSPPPTEYVVASHRQGYSPPGRFGELVDKYRCQSCHRIRGSGVDIAKADLTFEGSKVKRDWLEQYLLVPTTIRPLLTDRMVPLRLPQEESRFIAEFIENVYVDDDIPRGLFEDGLPQERVERGRALFHERYGCQACHMVNNRGGYYGPLMNGLGDRLEPGWIAWWLQGPQRWREDLRCPDYGMDGTDAEDLAAYIAAVSGGDGSEESGNTR